MAWVNRPQTEAELAALRQSVTKGKSFGSMEWVQQMVRRWSLKSTLRFRGWPNENT
jgi:putative transposase